MYAVFVETQDAKAIRDKVIATFDQQVQDLVVKQAQCQQKIIDHIKAKDKSLLN